MIEDLGVVDEVPEVEVEEVEAVAGFAYEDQGRDAEGAGEEVVAGEADDDAAKEGHQEAVVNDGVGDLGAEPEEEEDGGESEDAQEEARGKGPGHEFVELGEDDAEDEAGHVRERGELEGLQPWPVAETVGVSDAVGLEEDVESAGDESDGPDDSEAREDGRGTVRTLDADDPGEEEVIEGLGGHGPRGGVEEGGDFRDPALKEERREDQGSEEEGVGVAGVFGRQVAPGEEEAKQVNGIDAGEAGLPETHCIELAVASAGTVVVGEDVAGEEDEEADGGVSGIDDRGEVQLGIPVDERQREMGPEMEPIRIGEVKEDDVDGGEGAKAR